MRELGRVYFGSSIHTIPNQATMAKLTNQLVARRLCSTNKVSQVGAHTSNHRPVKSGASVDVHRVDIGAISKFLCNLRVISTQHGHGEGRGGGRRKLSGLVATDFVTSHALCHTQPLHTHTAPAQRRPWLLHRGVPCEASDSHAYDVFTQPLRTCCQAKRQPCPSARDVCVLMGNPHLIRLCLCI